MFNSPWRSDFPTLNNIHNTLPLIYLDSAATAQTPLTVIERMQRFYTHEYATVHRGVHRLSANATHNMEQARQTVAEFVKATSSDQIIFTKGTTEAINLVANTFLPTCAQAGDEIIITDMEHHSNIVPWQMLAERLGLTIKIWKMTAEHTLELDDLRYLVSKKTKLLALSHVSNVLGCINPIKAATAIAHQFGAAVLIDGAQGIMHQAVDVQDIGCDFYAFSGHKLYGPTGIGVLYIAKQWINTLPPWEGGGAMIDRVQLPMGTTYQTSPWRFEAGTPNIAGILGLSEAINYINHIGMDAIIQHEDRLIRYAEEQMRSVDALSIYGKRANRVGVISFNLGNHHAFDIGSFLDNYGVAIRTGHHCAMPLLQRLEQSVVCRASVGLYNDSQDIDVFVDRLQRIKQLLG
ncbi:SufS family cysteine desulfurase [Photobacterium kishitanii]|uniref:SufS family cysteine desulfurase n=1 Tax=Photobacterium kishitanii TaxID=318456 RepID=UPI0004324426|nr:SufS family cysteine desulfurase [Photobacterium kishitanii]OBU29272.1 cysteine sulfinate desulfinase [Photobacterium kishitanii]PSV24080.1 SufS family cysteine desulfurase [Photobacterium kishitanii]PSW69757.1 SufS family cysteine desulfurase [Photobacterium kishitanii]CEO39180.1 selenocysteine lyase, PLP-dependent [Photobacterium kishitanii]